ncbi:MAG: HAMP domain-containing histidine kinase [Clostridia bacterium]|nr:HAMP domain-containing histidine kinase [Clostridia bacterium]
MKKHILFRIVILCVALAGFSLLLFYTDNKYQTPPPYGGGGVIALSEGDLRRGEPVYLIDGWLLTSGSERDLPTYVGEFSNLQRGDLSASPHGEAVYRLTLRYSGQSVRAAVEFPMLFARHEILLDGETLDAGVGDARAAFLLSEGDHLLEVRTRSTVGYYSGMYLPPALSTEGTILALGDLRSLAYALALLVPLALALFTLVLWRTGGALARWFGLLCCSFSLYVAYYFVRLFRWPAAEYWFYAKTAALYSLVFCVVMLCAHAAKEESCAGFRAVKWILLGVPCVLLGLCPLFPVIPWTVALHGLITDCYFMFAFCATVFLFVRAALRKNREYQCVLAGCTVFGAGLFQNLLFSNCFEPIRFYWQFEWCGLLLVGLFGGMMAARNRRILSENALLTNHLEDQVTRRTQELHAILQERKAFFADMAHDLKAPVFATQAFISAIRESGVGVDKELLRYLDLAESKQQEMAHRLQGLNTINALDKIEGPRERLSIRALLEEVYAAYHAEAEVSSIHLTIELPEGDGFLLAQPEKLELMFENLIYNALRATPSEGSVSVSAGLNRTAVTLTVADTGCGIPPDELPHIFDRFFVGMKNKELGSGLGLYIVKSIVDGLGGSIRASSTPGQGTAFFITLPLANE